MRVQKRISVTIICLLAILANGAGVFAQVKRQPKGQKPDPDVIVQGQEGKVFVAPRMPGHFEVAVDGPADRLKVGDTFLFVASEVSFDGRVVKNAPYSAQAITETTQALSDGNRIVRKTNASVYRDSEGRTRRDQVVGAVGPYAAGGDPPLTWFINDPVEGVNYILDPRSRTARKQALPYISYTRKDGSNMQVTINTNPVTAEERASVERFTAATVEKLRRMDGESSQKEVAVIDAGPGSNTRVITGDKLKDRLKTESLGKQTIEGVEAEGTRTTFTIPAGEIGNEQPINIVTERWYSPELQTLIMSRHSDPRSGETVYRLTNINRSEPARSLFEVPSDYTIKEGPSVMRLRDKVRNDDK